MARLALASRNPMMSMGLSSTEHDIEELRVGKLDAWLAAGKDSLVDALVLDLQSPHHALRVVGDLRAAGRWTPVLLVTDNASAWNQSDLRSLPGVNFLSLPIDAKKLRGAVEAVLLLPTAPPGLRRGPTLPSDPLTAPLLDEIDEPPDIPEPSLLVHDTLVDDVMIEESAREELEPVTALPASLEPEVAESTTFDNASPTLAADATRLSAHVFPPAAPTEIPIRAVVPETPVDIMDAELRPRRRLREKTPSEATGRARVAAVEPHGRHTSRWPTDPSPTASSPGRRATDHLNDLGTAGMVSSLLESQFHLYTLAEASDVVLDDAVRKARADAGALLVPDGEVWRVTAGVGVRPIELRYQLTADSWLIERVGASKRGIIILDSDIARSDLRGAPLASHPHLMALPVPSVRAVMLLARDCEPTFDEGSLSELVEVAVEAGPLLERALLVRLLARSLQRHLDLE